MLKEKQVSMELVKGSQNEYIIRDKSGITIGRIFISDLSKPNKYCSLKIKFYKYGEKSYANLKETLITLLNLLIKNMGLYKINVFTDEEINTASFIDLGFELEGVLSNSIIEDGVNKDQFIFGIDSDTYDKKNKDKNVFIKGKTIDLKVLTPNDAEKMLDYYKRNEEYLRDFEPKREDSFYTLAVQKKILIESYKQYINGTSVNFGIYKEECLIGKIQLSNIVIGIFKNAFVGYSIDEKYQGKGFMKEALQLVNEYAFNEIGLHRIEASTLTDNIKSQKVLRSCGFKEIGLNEKYLFINGKWRDHMSFYKLKEEK